MNANFSQTVNHQVQELQKKKCCGCEVNHPSQRRHGCIMITEEERSIYYKEKEYLLQKGIVWKQFRQAIRIMKLIPHEHILNTVTILSYSYNTE